MGNPFVHMELLSIAPEQAKAFYGKLFDWSFDDITGAENTPYSVIRVGDGTGGGIMKNPMPVAPSLWMPYVLVEDLRASTDKAITLGASLMKDITEVPGIGEFTIIADPAGGMIGLWKPSAK